MTTIEVCDGKAMEATRLREENERMRAELIAARETIVRLNRRCQSAESGLAAKLESGPCFGRALANSAAVMWHERHDEAQKRIAELEAKIAELAAGHKTYPEEDEDGDEG